MGKVSAGGVYNKKNHKELFTPDFSNKPLYSYGSWFYLAVLLNLNSMKRGYYTGLFFLVPLIFCFCKKNSDGTGSVLGKWIIDSVQVVGRPYNEEIMVTIYRNAGENFYFDFRPDSVQIYWSATSYVTKYNLVQSSGKTLLQFDQSYAADTVLKLTPGNMILTSRQGGRSLYFFSK